MDALAARGSTKKLIDAVQHWLRGGISESTGDAQMAARLRQMGVPQKLIERQCNQRTDFPLWPENVTPVRVFRAMAGTQWNMLAGMGGASVVGLRYESLPIVFDMLQVPAAQRPDCFEMLRIMERAAIKGINAPAKG